MYMLILLVCMVLYIELYTNHLENSAVKIVTLIFHHNINLCTLHYYLTKVKLKYIHVQVIHEHVQSHVQQHIMF